jgi:hypothetical protein
MFEEIVVRGKRKIELYNYFLKESTKIRLEDEAKSCFQLLIEESIENNQGNEQLSNSPSTIENSHWKVCLSDEGEYKLGSMKFPEVKISFEGENQSIKQIMHDFRVEFLSAGG